VGHNYCYAHLAGFTALLLLPGDTYNDKQINRQMEQIGNISTIPHFNLGAHMIERIQLFKHEIIASGNFSPAVNELLNLLLD